MERLTRRMGIPGSGAGRGRRQDPGPKRGRPVPTIDRASVKSPVVSPGVGWTWDPSALPGRRGTREHPRAPRSSRTVQRIRSTGVHSHRSPDSGEREAGGHCPSTARDDGSAPGDWRVRPGLFAFAVPRTAARTHPAPCPLSRPRLRFTLTALTTEPGGPP